MRSILIAIMIAITFAFTTHNARANVPMNIVHCAIVIPAYNFVMWDENDGMYMTHYIDAGDRIIYKGNVPRIIKTLVENPPRHYWGNTRVRVWGCR